MEKNLSRSSLLPIVIIPICGLLVLALCYAGYFAIYMFIESVFFPHNPTSVPAGTIRNAYTVFLLAIYWLIIRTKIRDLFKAIILVGPLTMLVIAVNLALYLKPVLAIASTLAIAICFCYLFYRYKKSWVYYYAAGFSVGAAIFYAWPRG